MFHFHRVTMRQIYACILKCLKSLRFREPGLPQAAKNQSARISHIFYTIVGSHFHAPLEMS